MCGNMYTVKLLAMFEEKKKKIVTMGNRTPTSGLEGKRANHYTICSMLITIFDFLFMTNNCDTYRRDIYF